MSITGATGTFGAMTQSAIAGNYQVVIRDNNLCVSAIKDTVIKEPAKVTFDIDTATASCSNSNDGHISFTKIQGGLAPYTTSIYGDDPSNYTSATDYTNLGPGSFDLIVQDVNGCKSDQENITLSDAGQIIVGYSVPSSQICYGGSDTVVLSASGGSGNYEYAVTTSSADPTSGWQDSPKFLVLGSTSQYGFVKDKNSGCIGYANNNQPMVLGTISKIIITVNSIDSTSCAETADGVIRLAPATGGNNNPYTYFIDGTNMGTVRVFNSLSKGNHTVTVQDKKGCSEDSIIAVPGPPAIIPSLLSKIDLKCYNVKIGEIHATAIGGVGALTYALDAGSFGATADYIGLDGGDHILHVLDATGCQKDTTINLAEPDSFMITTAVATDITCNGLNNGILNVKASGGTTPYIYTLYPAGTVTNATGDFTGLSAGKYVVEVSETNLCGTIKTDSLEIINPDVISIDSVSKEDITCGGTATGKMIVYAKGGTRDLVYNLTGSHTYSQTGDSAFNALLNGTYNISVTDANNCPAATAASIAITQATPIVWNSFTIVNPLCDGSSDGSVNISATGGSGTLMYWYDANSPQASGLFSWLDSNTYQLHVIDSLSCQKDTSVTLVDPDPVTISSVQADSVCSTAQGQIIAVAAGGTAPYTYTLLPDNISNGSGIFPALDPNTYTISVTDINSCPNATKSVSIDTFASPVITVNSTNISCKGGATGIITINVSGGKAPFTYSINGDVPANYGALSTFNGLTANTYPVYVKDACGSHSFGNVVITEPANALVITSLDVDSVVTCNGDNDGSITINATGGSGTLQYSIFGGAPFINNNSYTNLGAGVYNIVVQDDSLCQQTATATIYNPNVLNINSIITTKVQGATKGTATVNVMPTENGSGSLMFWYDSKLPQASNLFTSLNKGTYLAHVTDVNNCQDTMTFVIEDTLGIDLTAIVTDPTCFGFTNGKIDTTITGGFPPYTFTIVPNVTDLDNVPAGNYKLTASDTAGNMDSLNVVVNPALPLAATIAVTNYDGTAANGKITVNASGGSGSFEYNLNNAGYVSSNVFDSLAANTYTLQIRDVNGCGVIDTTAEVLDDTKLEVYPPYVDNVKCFGTASGSVRIEIKTGKAPFRVRLLKADTILGVPVTTTLKNVMMYGRDTTFEGLTEGTYNIIVRHSLPGPSWATGNFRIEDNNTSLLTIDSKVATPQTDMAPNGTITILASGGTGGMTSYQFSNDSANAFVDNAGEFTDLAGNQMYYIAVQDLVGCVIHDSIFVPMNIQLNVDFSKTNTTCSGLNDGTVAYNITSGNGTYQYSFNGALPFVSAAVTDTFKNLGPGTYTLAVTDGVDTASYIADILAASAVVIDSIITTPSANGTTGTMTVYVNPNFGSGIYTFSATSKAHGPFNNGNSNVFTSLPADSFFVRVDDGLCSFALDTAVVSQDTVLQGRIDSVEDVNCFELGWRAYIDVTALNPAPGSITYRAYPAKNPLDISEQIDDSRIEVYDTGKFYVEIVDSEGKKYRDSAFIKAIVEPIVVDLAPSKLLCSAGETGSIISTVSGGKAPYQYKWFKNTDLVSTDKDLVDFGPGKYRLQVTDSFKCKRVEDDSIFLNKVKIHKIEKTQSTCNVGKTDGTIKVTATASSGEKLHYTWSGGNLPDTSYVTKVGAGTYKLQVSTATGCFDTATVVISSKNSLVSTWQYADFTCQDSAYIGFNITVGEPSFKFITDNTLTIDTIDTVSTSYFKHIPEGSYKFKLEDQKGCYDTLDFIVHPIPANDSVIIDTVYTTMASGGSTGIIDVRAHAQTQLVYYLLDTTNVLLANNGPDSIFNGLAAGIYRVKVTNISHCDSATIDVVVEQNTVLDAKITYKDSVCNGAVVVITPINPFGKVTYNVTTDSVGFYIQQVKGRDSMFIVSNTGVYHISAVDAENKRFDYDTLIPVSVPGLFALAEKTNISCDPTSTGSFRMTIDGGTPPYHYAWLNETTGDTISKQQTDYLDAPLGKFRFNLKDDAGCEFNYKDSLAFVPLNYTLNLVDTPSCITNSDTSKNGTLAVTIGTGVAPFIYQWRDTVSKALLQSDTTALFTDTLKNVYPSVYQLTILDVNGCQKDTIFTVNAADTLDVSFTLTQASCQAYGQLIIKSIKGTPKFDYTINGVQLESDLNAIDDTLRSLKLGKYNIIVGDGKGCQVRDSMIVNLTEPMELSSNIIDKTCENYGEISMSFSKTMYPVYVVVNGGADTLKAAKDETLKLSMLNEGAYGLKIWNDIDGCAIDSNLSIGFNSTLVNIYDNARNKNCTSLGAISLATENIAYPVYVTVNDGLDTLKSLAGEIVNINDLDSGKYTLKVWNDIKGCEFNVRDTIKLYNNLAIVDTVFNQTCFDDGVIKVRYNNINDGYYYRWVNDTIDGNVKNATDTILRSVRAGQYILEVIDSAFGCSKIDTFDVIQRDSLKVFAGLDTTICRGVEYLLEGRAFAGKSLTVVDGAFFNWTPVQNLIDNKANIPNPIIRRYIPNSYKIDSVQYMLSVTYGNCTNSDSVVISYHESNGVWLPAQDTASKGNYEIIPSIGGTGSFVSYMWLPHTYVVGGTDTARNLVVNFLGDSLTYQFIGVSSEGCVESASIRVIATDDINPDGAFSPNGDGANEFWYIPNAEYFPDIVVKVFNRWGNLVYESKGYNNADVRWTGKRSGKDMPIGTYYYIVTTSGSKTKKGTVTLMR
jgi:gliding motility-associated-like protein